MPSQHLNNSTRHANPKLYGIVDKMRRVGRKEFDRWNIALAEEGMGDYARMLNDCDNFTQGDADKHLGDCGGCYECVKDTPMSYMVMICCVECGNKRCPKATYHAYTCTKSNEPGQPGSRFEGRVNDQ